MGMKKVKKAKHSKHISKLSLLIVVGLIAVTVASCGTNTSPQSSTIIQTTAATTAMNTTQQTTTAVTATTAITTTKSLADADKVLTLVGYGAKGALSDDKLSVADMLNYAIQDEYLARGEYVAIMGKFGEINPYANIKKSEDTHIAYLTELYIAYDLAMPMDDSKSHLVIPTDLQEAAKTGVQAEIDNIAMYESFLGQSLPLDVLEVFTSLKNASESHLAAFQKQVEKLS